MLHNVDSVVNRSVHLYCMMTSHKQSKLKHVLKPDAYPAIWRPVDAHNSAIPWDIPQK